MGESEPARHSSHTQGKRELEGPRTAASVLPAATVPSIGARVTAGKAGPGALALVPTRAGGE